MSPDQPARPVVLFVAVPAPLGGSNRSLATLLEEIGPRVVRVLAAPMQGEFGALVRERGLAEETIDLPWKPRFPNRMHRIWAALRLARWSLRHRTRIDAIHANATRALSLSVLPALVTRAPVTVWVHDPVGSPWGRRLGPILRWLLQRPRFAAVSRTAASVAVENGLCTWDEVTIVPNPIDPADVVAERSDGDGPLVVGYLSAGRHRKGFDLLPDIIEGCRGLDLQWRLFTKRLDSDYATPVWQQLDAIQGVDLVMRGPDSDVRRIYEQCDIVLVASRDESFSRITAEAMLNGIPVVASDLEPIRQLLDTDGQAGLLFPPGDTGLAAARIKQLAESAELRMSCGAEGRRKAEAFTPDVIVRQLLTMYEVEESARP